MRCTDSAVGAERHHGDGHAPILDHRAVLPQGEVNVPLGKEKRRPCARSPPRGVMEMGRKKERNRCPALDVSCL